MRSYFRIAPGLKLRAAPSGFGIGVGPRAGRVWIGSHGVGVSTGAGPISLYKHLGGSRRSYPSSMAAYERQVRQARQAEELARLARQLEEMLSVHRQAFAPANPPVAPPAAPVDTDAIERRHRKEALRTIPLLRLSERRAAKERARASAPEEAASEGARLERERDAAQRLLDEAWRRLLANDPDTVLQTLAEAFADNRAPAVPVDCQDARATVLLVLDGMETVPERVPYLTPTGRPSSRKLPKTERNELYLGWLSSNLLATVREALAVCPGLSAVTVAVLRREPMDPFGERSLSAVYAGTISRAMCERIVWDAPEALDAIFYAEGLLVKLKGRTRETVPLDLTDRPDLARVVGEVRYALQEAPAAATVEDP